MRSLLLAGFAAATFVGAPAFAADIPVKAPPPPPPSEAFYSWTGFYIGLNAGYGWHDPQVTFTGNDPIFSIPALTGGIVTAVPLTINPKGFVGGIQAGYNFRVAPMWVFGVEGDFQGASLKARASTPIVGAFPGSPGVENASSSLSWFGTLRARLGLLATERLLIYGTGGFAYGRSHVAADIGAPGPGFTGPGGTTIVCIPNCYFGSQSKIVTGWAGGGGAEWAFARNATVRLEYLRLDLGGRDLFLASNTTAGPFVSATAHFHDINIYHIVRVALNWTF